MKDIVIKSQRIRKEIIIWLSILIITYIGNIISIIKYKTSWNELYSSVFYVLTISFIIYIIFVLFRLLLFSIIKLLKKGKKSK